MPRVVMIGVLVSMLGAAFAGRAAGQQVAGLVVDGASGVVVAGAAVALRAEDGDGESRTVTDEAGRFVLPAHGAGAFTLAVSRIGYQDFVSEPVRISSGERLVVEIRLGVDAVPLTPLVVSDRSRQHPPDITAFYERLERGHRSGDGHFISRADVESLHAARTTDLLRSVSGVHVVYTRGGRDALVRMRGGCIPAIYVDGSHINKVDLRLSLDQYVAARSIEGIEVHRGSGRAVAHMHDPSGCGLILVWTRRGERDGSAPLRWKTVAVVLGAVLGLFLVLN